LILHLEPTETNFFTCTEFHGHVTICVPVNLHLDTVQWLSLILQPGAINVIANLLMLFFTQQRQKELSAMIQDSNQMPPDFSRYRRSVTSLHPTDISSQKACGCKLTLEYSNQGIF